MAIAIEGIPVVDGFQAPNTSFTCTLPGSIASGELLVIDAICGDKTKSLSVTGWSTIQIPHSTFSRNIIWKKATGSEGASVTVNLLPSGTANAHLTSFRMSGIDTEQPFNAGDFYAATLASTATPSIPAGSMVITPGSGILAGIACEAVRSVTVFDVELDVEVVMSSGTISNHVYLDIAEAGTTNPVYDFVTSDSRAYDVDLIELFQPNPVFEQTAQIDVTITVDANFPGAAPFTYPLTGNINVDLGVNSWQTGIDEQTGSINVVMGVNGAQIGGQSTVSADKLNALIYAGPRRFG